MEHDKKEQLAAEAIRQGKTMGQFLWDLPGSKQMTKEELQKYAKAYDRVRRGK